jgi:hypothetical protein
MKIIFPYLSAPFLSVMICDIRVTLNHSVCSLRYDLKTGQNSLDASLILISIYNDIRALCDRYQSDTAICR